MSTSGKKRNNNRAMDIERPQRVQMTCKNKTYNTLPRCVVLLTRYKYCEVRIDGGKGKNPKTWKLKLPNTVNNLKIFLRSYSSDDGVETTSRAGNSAAAANRPGPSRRVNTSDRVLRSAVTGPTLRSTAERRLRATGRKTNNCVMHAGNTKPATRLTRSTNTSKRHK